MIEAKKMNKVLRIEEAEKGTYISLGYDIYEDGKLVEYGVGKTVPYAKYEALQQELEALKSAKKDPAKK